LARKYEGKVSGTASPERFPERRGKTAVWGALRLAAFKSDREYEGREGISPSAWDMNDAKFKAAKQGNVWGKNFGFCCEGHGL